MNNVFRTGYPAKKIVKTKIGQDLLINNFLLPNGTVWPYLSREVPVLNLEALPVPGRVVINLVLNLVAKFRDAVDLNLVLSKVLNLYYTLSSVS